MGGHTEVVIMPRERMAPRLVVAYVSGLARSVARGNDPTTTNSYERDMDAVRTAARDLHCAASALRGDLVRADARSAHSFSSSLAASRSLGVTALQALGLTARGNSPAADSKAMAQALDRLAAKLDKLASGDEEPAEEIATTFSEMVRLATKTH